MSPSDVLTREESETIAKKVFGLAPPHTRVEVKVLSSRGVSTRFSRGDTELASEGGGALVSVRLGGDDRKASADGVRIDDQGLKDLVALADSASREWRGTPKPARMRPATNFKEPPKLYFEANMPLMAPDGRGALLAAALDATEKAGVVGAGGVSILRKSTAIINTEGLFGYTRQTTSQFSMTARTRDGTGSGWAWTGHEDWSLVDTNAAIARAVDLCLRSRNPVAVEPGRYTVILEPAAVAALIETINWDAYYADHGMSVFSKNPLGTNKIGLQMLDRRLNMVSDPWDPLAPRPTFNEWGVNTDKVQWFTAGILTNLSYSPYYAEEAKHAMVMGPDNLRMYGDGPTQSLDDMIAGTKRGIWVNRLSVSGGMNMRKTGLLTGTTRDGTFLIENGKITKAIKNLRYTESPFFIFNKLESFGDPIRASFNTVAPRMKVRDFDFTSLTDAI